MCTLHTTEQERNSILDGRIICFPFIMPAFITRDPGTLLTKIPLPVLLHWAAIIYYGNKVNGAARLKLQRSGEGY